mgnify:FL=1
MLSWPIQNTSQMEEGSIVPPITPMLHHKRHHGTELQPKGQVRIIRTVMQMGGQSLLYSSYHTSLVSLLIVMWLSVAVGKMRTCSFCWQQASFVFVFQQTGMFHEDNV